MFILFKSNYIFIVEQTSHIMKGWECAECVVEIMMTSIYQQGLGNIPRIHKNHPVKIVDWGGKCKNCGFMRPEDGWKVECDVCGKIDGVAL